MIPVPADIKCGTAVTLVKQPTQNIVYNPQFALHVACVQTKQNKLSHIIDACYQNLLETILNNFNDQKLKAEISAASARHLLGHLPEAQSLRQAFFLSILK